MDRDFRPPGLPEHPLLLEATTFNGMVVVITGASRLNGLGAEMARQFAKAGASGIVTISTQNSAEDGIALSQELLALGAEKTLHITADLKNSHQVAEMAAKIREQFGRVDVIVNNAGINPKEAPFQKLDKKEYLRAFYANTLSAVFVSEELLTLFPKDGGSIINISSTVGVYGNKNQAAYAISKAALIGFTNTMALELQSRNIRVNAVSPGLVSGTEMTANLPDVATEAMRARSPHDLATQEDVAKVVIELAHPQSTITRMNIEVDGGLGSATPLARDEAAKAIFQELRSKARSAAKP